MPAAGSAPPLRAYRAKRNLARSGELDSVAVPAPAAAGRFVIQKHAATHLHYDLRLEMNGVLKSWAVPKGLPFRASAKSLAIEVEDHPLDYASFEGVIPAGNYGAGTVMVWDRGTYAVKAGDPARAYREGKIHLLLAGRKCLGEWTLVRLRSRGTPAPHWLLLKNRSGPRVAQPAKDDRSALTGRTFEEIARSASTHR